MDDVGAPGPLVQVVDILSHDPNRSTPRPLRQGDVAGIRLRGPDQPDRQRYQPQTSSGSAAQPDGLASAIGSKRSHGPGPGAPGVRMPGSADIPAPVSTTTRRAARAASTRSGGVSRTRVRPGVEPLVEKVEEHS